MKKILLFFVFAVMTVAAPATTITWSGNTSNSVLLGLDGPMSYGVTSETASLKVYYILYSNYDAVKELGKATATEISSYVIASASGQAKDNETTAGRFAKSTGVTAYETAGVSFFARAYATFDGTEYFIDLFGGDGSGGVWETKVSGASNTPEQLSWVNGSYGGSTSETVGTKNAWISTAAVPEPATGALALAGIALLFKRRKARA